MNYSDINSNEFTQKDLMLHLLHVSQHTVTREELKEDISDLKAELNDKIDRLDAKFDKRFEQVDKRFDQIDKRFDQIDGKFDKVASKFDKIDSKFEEVHKEIKDSKVETIKWIVSMFFANIITMTGLGFTAFKLFSPN